MWKRICLTLAIASVLVVALLGSVALAATEPVSSTDPTLSTDPVPSTQPASVWEKYIFEGIPRPQWDAAVDGWIRYLGNGEFISEFGREFFWRDGHFVNADGSTMELPPSAKDHLNSLGIYRQPTAEDVANWDMMRATSPTQDGMTAGGAIALASWSGLYLHVGRTTTNGMTHLGNQADISVFDRSPGYAEYYGIGLHHYSIVGDLHCGLEFCDQQGTYPNTLWVPLMHAIMDGHDYEYPYASFEFATDQYTSITKNLKLAVKTSGYIWPYCDGANMDYDHLFWGQSSYAYGESAYEIGSDSRTVAPHDPANHHSNIKTQSSIGGSWSLQTEAISKYNKVLDGNGTEYNGVYNSNWIINPNYNWMARPL